MIENILIRKQTPKEGMWLTRFDKQSNTYNDTQCAYLGKEDTEWDECTEQEHEKHLAHNARVQEEQEKANFEQNL
jgi:hypothetical protein